MKRLLRAEFYKLHISFTFKIFTLCNFTTAICSVIIISMLGNSSLTAIPNEILEQIHSNGVYNIGFIQFNDISDLLNISSDFVIYSSFKNYFPLIYLAIFITIYILKEFQYGGIRNFLLKGFNRTIVIFSKYVALMTCIALNIVIYFFCYCVTSIIAFGPPNVGNIKIMQIIIFLTIQIFLYISFASICIMLVILIQHNTVIFINASMVIMGTMIINLIMIITNNQINLSKFWILNYVQKLTPIDIDISLFTVGIITIIVSVIITIIKFKHIEFN